MSCLNSIVTLGSCGDNSESLSGFKLISAAGISTDTLAKLATSDNHTGVKLALEKKGVALLKVKNDVMNVLVESGAVTDITDLEYTTGDILMDKGLEAAANYYRGVSVHMARPNDTVMRMVVPSFSFIPSATGTVSFMLRDGVTVHNFDIEVEGGVLNTVQLSDVLGEEYVVKTGKVTIAAITNTIQFYKSSVTCLKGCNGAKPNGCGWADGYKDGGRVRTDGFGIVVHFRCYCDYDELLCALSKTLVGELIYLKWQIEIFEENALSTRFNEITVYRGEEAAERAAVLSDEYRAKFKALAKNLKRHISRINTKCVKCLGVKWVTNI